MAQDAGKMAQDAGKQLLRHRTLARHAYITYGSVIAGFGFLLVGYLAGMQLHHWRGPLGYRVGSAWQAYGGLFVLAAAIERLIPVSYTHLRAHETVLDL